MQHLDYIDDYFKGEFSGSKTRYFEAQITEDSHFAEEVAFYLSAMQLLRQSAQQKRKAGFRVIYKKWLNK